MENNDASWKEFVPCGTVEFFEKKKGKVLWFTGPSGAGKSTIANLAKEKIEKTGRPVKVLDGDELRKGISSNLGLSPEDRTEHNRRIAHLAKTLTDVGAIVIVALISPFEETRQAAKEIIGEDKFNLVYIKSSQEHRIERDPKGLYKRAMDGEIKDLTGFDGRYDDPEESGEEHFMLDTDKYSANSCANDLLRFYL
jgi:adenylylsulfate kinase